MINGGGVVTVNDKWGRGGSGPNGLNQWSGLKLTVINIMYEATSCIYTKFLYNTQTHSTRDQDGFKNIMYSLQREFNPTTQETNCSTDI